MNERTREQFLRLLSESDPKVRRTTMAVVGERVSADNVGYIKEDLSFVQEDQTIRQVTFIQSGLCDCGKLISADNPLKATCQRAGCSRVTCSECVRTCRCGRSYCPRHASVYGDSTIYCHRCRPKKWVRMFFRIKENGGKK